MILGGRVLNWTLMLLHWRHHKECLGVIAAFILLQPVAGSAVMHFVH